MLIDDFRIRTFRLDVGQRTVEETSNRIKEFFDKYSEIIPKYVIALEVADITKKLHFQGLFWCDKSAKMENAFRMFNSWAPSEKAFRPVKNLESYQKYIKKQGDIKLIKGITDDEIEKWGEWEAKALKERKESHRKEQYSRFITFLKSQPDIEIGKYKLEWVARKLFSFLGKEPLPEQTNWIRGMIFSSQTYLIYENDKDPKGEAAINKWIDRILF